MPRDIGGGIVSQLIEPRAPKPALSMSSSTAATEYDGPNSEVPNPEAGSPARRNSRVGTAVTAVMIALIVALVAGIIWYLRGGGDAISHWAAQGQRSAQSAMAAAIRALKTGQPGAILSLMGLCFTYGLFHAAGPGHGKLLIGGYGLGRPVGALRLAGLALASSLAQSLTAVLLVAAGFWAFDWSRERLVGLADTTLSMASALAIAAVGLWLALRGLRRLWRSLAPQRGPENGQDKGHELAHGPVHEVSQAGVAQAHQGLGHDADDSAQSHSTSDGICNTCGHAHGPSPEAAAQVRSLRDAIVLIAAVAVRPCTGALFLLIITFRMGLFGPGIAGAFAMGVGTASVTILTAMLSVLLRDRGLGVLADRLPNARHATQLMALVETLAGGVIACAAVMLALRYF